MKNNAKTLPPDEVERRIFGRPLTDLNRPQPPLSAGAKEARMLMEKARLAQEAQLKEKQMPDLKTELTKVINQWSHEEQPAMNNTNHIHRNVTNNVTRATFDHIRDNPGKTRSGVAASLIALGYNASSVTSLIGQMTRQRLVREEDAGKLYTNQKEYTPIKRTQLPKPKRAAKPKAVAVAAPIQRKHIELVNTRTGEVFNPRKEEWSVESVIGGLNVRQAMAVYDELRKIFGA